MAAVSLLKMGHFPMTFAHFHSNTQCQNLEIMDHVWITMIVLCTYVRGRIKRNRQSRRRAAVCSPTAPKSEKVQLTEGNSKSLWCACFMT